MTNVDIYVGTLTRYYCAAWDTVQTRLAKSRGEPFHLFKPRPGPGFPEINPIVIEPIVVAWRENLAVKVAPHLATRLMWAEGMQQKFYSMPLGSGGYSGMLLAAAYAQNPALVRPTGFVENYMIDPAVKECFRRRPETPIFNSVNSLLWLPGDFNFGTQVPDPVGQVLQIGSLGLLKRALESLNDLMFQADEAEVTSWAKAGLRPSEGFETQIRFGFATLFLMCQHAIECELPMKLHY